MLRPTLILRWLNLMIEKIKNIVEIILYICFIVFLCIVSVTAYSIYKSNSIEFEKGYHVGFQEAKS